MSIFTDAFFDELEKLGARRSTKPKKLRMKTIPVKMPVIEESRSHRATWGRRLGLIIGRLFKHRVLADQLSKPPRLKIPKIR